MDLIEATHAIKRSPFLILNQLCAKRVNTQFILVQRVQRFFFGAFVKIWSFIIHLLRKCEKGKRKSGHKSF